MGREGRRELVRHELRSGVSAAVNELVRRVVVAPLRARTFVQQTSTGRARVDITDVAAVLELLDEDDHGAGRS